MLPLVFPPWPEPPGSGPPPFRQALCSSVFMAAPARPRAPACGGGGLATGGQPGVERRARLRLWGFRVCVGDPSGGGA